MIELNYGPHHPSTHGVLRLKLELEDERIIKCEPIIGYLHRNIEKLAESRSFISVLPLIDRIDYLAPLLSEHAYVMAIERALNLEVPRRAEVIRTIFDELTRISCHILAIACATYDIGIMNLFLYSFEEREKIMEIFENTTGNRMFHSYYIPGGVFADLSNESIILIKKFIHNIRNYLTLVEDIALNNRLFKLRTQGVGIISTDLLHEFGITGPCARAGQVKIDIRKEMPYGIYEELDFDYILLSQSDCLTRTKLRYLEIKQSIEIITACLDLLYDSKYKLNYNLSNLRLPSDIYTYASVENSRGEFGIHLNTDSTGKYLSRIHINSPSFSIIQMLPKLLKGELLSNISVILGSLDFLLGDCDR